MLMMGHGSRHCSRNRGMLWLSAACVSGLACGCCMPAAHHGHCLPVPGHPGAALQSPHPVRQVALSVPTLVSVSLSCSQHAQVPSVVMFVPAPSTPCMPQRVICRMRKLTSDFVQVANFDGKEILKVADFSILCLCFKTNLAAAQPPTTTTFSVSFSLTAPLCFCWILVRPCSNPCSCGSPSLQASQKFSALSA